MVWVVFTPVYIGMQVEQPLALVGVKFVLLTIDAQASDTHRCLRALPAEKLKLKKN
ncbi:MAG: hypothetical protein MPL62_09175 [Alphaproteobacteria bacterium]|nr:hypothetical protein [Alphaproteobacteria bacterium]